MMNAKRIIIKKKTAKITSAAVIAAVMLLLSIACLFFPFIKDYTYSKSVLYISAGGVCTLYFTFMLFIYIFKLMSPQYALIATGNGITDFYSGSVGIGFIEKDRIKKISVFTAKGDEYLGIDIIEPEKTALKAKRAASKVILRNAADGVPAISIPQKELNVTVKAAAKQIIDLLNNGQTLIMEDIPARTNAHEIFETDNTAKKDETLITVKTADSITKRPSEEMKSIFERNDINDDAPKTIDELLGKFTADIAPKKTEEDASDKKE